MRLSVKLWCRIVSGVGSEGLLVCLGVLRLRASGSFLWYTFCVLGYLRGVALTSIITSVICTILALTSSCQERHRYGLYS